MHLYLSTLSEISHYISKIFTISPLLNGRFQNKNGSAHGRGTDCFDK